GDLFQRFPEPDENFFEELEAVLIAADVGVESSTALVESLRRRVKEERLHDPEVIRTTLRQEIQAILEAGHVPLQLEGKPAVVMVVGVNGTGKTSTVGKLAWRLRREGKGVLLAAADTFRAAADEQLAVWAARAGVEILRHQSGGDPAAVAFDAVTTARNRALDVVLVDTAGRLHTQANLMAELEKIKRVIGKAMPGAPQEILLVVDATTGQNALVQAQTFHQALGLTGLVLTKLDGTAKGGIVVAIKRALGIPVKLVGLGEGLEDLQDFSPEIFAQALFA
ncbi:MAG: signal recognition particle-docking protein FtsY, partial [Moorellales bacterium]